jgi:hypothetical protein
MVLDSIKRFKNFIHSLADLSNLTSFPLSKQKEVTGNIVLIIASALLVILVILTLFVRKPTQKPPAKLGVWEVQSVDTVKYSRDVARQFLNDPNFDAVIENQIALISSLGITHLAIGTPYDPEFVPYLRRWVRIARDYDLKIWFRGNLSGWEGWFDYGPITKEERKRGIEELILQNSDIFSDGDIFTSCTECENGRSSDPRVTGDVAGYRRFLIEEYSVSRAAFEKIGKKVDSNYFSMNADVARLVMDKKTTSALGGIVVIDHYVATPEKLENDIREMAKISGGNVILGEFGVPIPDIHGELSEKEQAHWLDEAMARISRIESLKGVNYWTSFGGSTQIWENAGRMRKIGDVIRKYYFYLYPSYTP